MEIVIVGNGIIALTVAYRLLDKIKINDKIVIIGNKERRGSATMVAPAMLNSFAELESDTLDTEIGRYKFDLSRAAAKSWPDFLMKIIKSAGEDAEKICPDYNGQRQDGWFDTGTYIINNTRTDDLDDENFNAIVRALKAYHEHFEWVEPIDIPNYAPKQAARSTRSIYINNEGWFNPKILIEMLESILKRHPQVTMVDKYVSKLSQRGSEIDFVQTDDGEIIHGDKFLLAAGAATTDLVRDSALSISMQRVFYGIGVTLHLYSPDHPHKKCVRTPNRGLACGLYSAPYYQGPNIANDHVAIGASNFISAVPCNRGRLTSVSTLMAGTIEQINADFYKAELVKVNVGERPLSQDGYPLVGLTSIKNLSIATGTKREGIHLAPVLSEKLVNIIMDNHVDAQFAKLRPERPLIHELSREAAIKKTIKHLMSAVYQHGFVPPDGKMIKMLKDKYEDDLQRLHDKVGAFNWGIPADMIDMYRYGHACLKNDAVNA